MLLMVITTGCINQEAKPIKEEKKTEYIEVTELEEAILEGQRSQKVEGLKAQFEAEQERIAEEKAEAERKKKEEEEQRVQQSVDPANMTAVEKAQWENANFADVHERANYLMAHPNHLNNIVTSDSVIKAYLNALNDDLQSSGELQTETILNGEMEAVNQE